jgi:GNAT superfamily N-acetyltransferase
MSAIEIRRFEPGQETIVSQLIKEVFDEFVAPGYTGEGNAFFHAFVEPETIRQRQAIQNSIFLAYLEGNLAGMIEMRDNSTVSLLFTRKEFMGLGIAGNLLKEGIALCRNRNEHLDRIFVHASPYSIPIYQKLGFSTDAVMQEAHGITYLPMEMKIIRE